MEPAGIESFGNRSVTVTDSQGFSQTVEYSVPEEVWLWVDIRYELYNDESFPANGETQLREAVLAWTLTEFGVGQDAFPGRFNTPIYTVQGIGRVQVKVCITPTNAATPTFPTDYVDTVLPVGGRNYASLTGTRLTTTKGLL